MGRTVTPEDIRAWAMALPEVSEKEHFRFKVPLWQVRGRTFLGMGRGEDTAVFCIAEADAVARATDDPEHVVVLHRPDGRRSFLGLAVRLDGVSLRGVQDLLREAWVAQAPRMLVNDLDDRTHAGRSKSRRA